MDSPNPATENLKRKRSPDDIGPARIGGGGHPVTQINYLVKARSERLRLIEGDAESFGDVLGMIDDYEGELR
jgi:hypothetical protein